MVKNCIMNFLFYHRKMIAAYWLSCIFLFACENSVEAVKKLSQKNTAIEEAKDVLVNYTIAGHTKAILKSPLMLNVEEAVPYVEFPKTLHVDFYDDQGKLESYLDARYAQYKQFQSKVHLRDSVVVINIENRDTLYCDELFWDRNRPGIEFYTDKPVRIRTKTQVLNGKGMESSQDFKNWRIIQSVGTIGIPSSRFPG